MEAPKPLMASDSISNISNGRPVIVGLDEYRVMPADTRLMDGRTINDLQMNEMAFLADGEVVSRCAWRSDTTQRSAKMVRKDPRAEVSGLTASTFSKADARAATYVGKHGKLHSEDIITTMEVMGMIPSAPKKPKTFWWVLNGDTYTVRMLDAGEFNYYEKGIDGLSQWRPQSTHLWQRVLRCENGDEIGVESVAEFSDVIVADVDAADWDYFELQAMTLGLIVEKSSIG